MKDIHELFEAFTKTELEDFLNKIDCDNAERFQQLAGVIIRNTIDEKDNENEFLYAVKMMIESSVNCSACVIIYDENYNSEFHIIGKLPENVELKIMGKNETGRI